MNRYIRFILERFDRMFMSDTYANKWSSNRVTFMFTVTISNLTFWLLVLFLTMTNHTFPSIPMEIVYIYGMANGFAMTGKITQQYSETKDKVSDNQLVIEKIKNGNLPHDLEPAPEEKENPNLPLS